ncbi:MAG: HDOD domain-containing protein [Spongiibacteraceae bacterium]|nr:HDOD domain-containing protein [Spongiibacteraceae bacterium]
MTDSSSGHDTEYWIKQLGKVQLPVLSGVMKDLNAVAQSDAGSASQISDIILRDAALTTKILRVANSAYHNPSSENTINTISRAVVQLGFQGIKAISLSVMLVDSLLKEKSKTRLLEWMARGFHTAVQAENLVKKAAKNETNEQVFITALLLHIGDMAFWSSRGKFATLLDKTLEPQSASNADVERKVLGTSIKDISIALANEWLLGDELLSALTPGHHPSTATQAVLLGEEISLATEKGWDSAAFRDVLVKASLFSGLGLEDARKMLMDGADRAAAVADSYGASPVSIYIPSSKKSKLEPVKTELGLHADPQLQLDILRELGAMVEQNVDVNTLFNMVIKGIHQGIGLERVALCLIDPKASVMKAKYVAGKNTEVWKEELSFPVKSEQDNLFAHCLHARVCVWMRREKTNSLAHLVNKKTTRLIDAQNCLISSIYAGNRPIGIIVADRGSKGVVIDAEQQESFEHFTQQISISLAMLAAKGAARSKKASR